MIGFLKSLKFLAPLCLVFLSGCGAMEIALLSLLSNRDSSETQDPSPGDGGTPCTTGCPQWKTLKIGGGGWLTGLDISNDGSTMVTRTDTFSAYIWKNNQWVSLVTASSMPAATVGADGSAQGIYEIRVAPNHPQRLYMTYFGSMYASRDQGKTWNLSALTGRSMPPGDIHRTLGQKMAVDPANPDIVFVGTTDNGLYVTRDGGVSFSQIADVPTGLQMNGAFVGITGIVFDTTSAVVGGATQRIYAASSGNGIYRSEDGGQNWTAMAGGPSSVTNAALGADGTYWAVSNGNWGTNVLWSLQGGVFQDHSNPGGGQHWVSVAPDPHNANRLVLGSSGGYLSQYLDKGVNWDGILWGVSRTALDIPWLEWTKEDYMSNANVLFDPIVPNKLWFSQGIGIWKTTLLATDTSVHWESQTLGIEQLVANVIIVPPGGKPVLGSWDRAFFTITDPDSYPLTHGPNRNNAIAMGWALDYAAQTPTFIAGIADYYGVEESGFSTDGGVTWSSFPTLPPWGSEGMGTLAVSTPQNIIWIPTEGKTPYYTLDQGATWQKVVLPGVPETISDLGWLHPAYYLNRHIIAADRVNDGTFYLFHARDGLFRTTDGGANWTLINNVPVLSGSTYNTKMKSVPGKAGHLYFTSGHVSGNTPTGSFMRSIDGGITWTAVPNVLEVHAFGFGKAASGSQYPAIYIAGWVDQVYGIYRSDDEGQQWEKIGDYPLGNFDMVKAIEGDMSVDGAVYVGFAGSGYVYRGR